MLREIVLPLCFLVLYVPICLIFWYETHGNVVDLLIFMLIGKATLVVYYAILLIVQWFEERKPKRQRKPRYAIEFPEEDVIEVETEFDNNDEPDEIEEAVEKPMDSEDYTEEAYEGSLEDDELLAFRQLFSEKQGGEVA